MTIASHHVGFLLAALSLPIVACSNDSSDSGDSTPAWGEECKTAYAGKLTYDINAPAQSCVDMINQLRAIEDVPALTRWTDGEACVLTELAADSVTGAQPSPLGTCGEFGRTMYHGSMTTPDAILLGFYCTGTGDNQHDIIVNASYTMAACGFYQATDGSFWVYLNFK